ncbi:hypothetical protein ACEWY4_012231 [Coilia grayii]|uniref:Ig-like domain-containing protein n=1 Tax=Coilia grayii TaxID=363190 RepID=A0ABD1K0I6_9TELE
MQCLVLIFLLMQTDICKSEESQTLVCHYDPEYADLQRVWCKKNSEECCTGFAFGEKITALDNGSVEINNTVNAFTITVHNLTEGNGTYWCGLMFKNHTIMKLAEKYLPISADSSLYEQVWSILRLTIFVLLVLTSVSTCLLTSEPVKKKISDEGNDGIRLRDRRHTDGHADKTVTEE